ncbi:MAG TPA: DUF4232 domain-containing protein [Candidatus Dormibacteraeota bacterium]|nr:DUF4232 domain-containing protein [Candidatus Dormibacteraeota bacterium]HVD03895.1 DUF4232 domain-containing protein [Candidatus Dormibacteraeota bacterium]
MRSLVGGTTVVALGLFLCACGNSPRPSPSPTAPTPTSSQSPAAAASPSATSQSPSAPSTTALASCSTAQLVGSLTSGEGAAGSVIYSLELQNVSSVSCTLFGNPGVSLVTGSAGIQLGAAASFVNRSAATRVTLAPNAKAGAILQIVEAGNFPASACDQTAAVGLRVYPPGQTAALFIQARGLEGCRDAGAQLLQVGPVTG